MSPEILSLLMLGGILIFSIAGTHIAFSLGTLGMLFGFLGMGPSIFPLTINRIFGLMNDNVFPAIPLFIFMGFVLERCGVAEKLYDSLYELMGQIKGGLAIATVIISTMLAACTGVIAASIVTMGVIALPGMLNKRYSKRLAAGTVVAGGTLGVMVPPSIVMILYGTVANLSVAKIFSAAIIPSLILSFLYVLYILIRCYMQADYGPSIKKEEVGTFNVKKVFWDIFVYAAPTIVLVVAVISSIVFGVVAITEAAAMGAFGAIILSLCYGKSTLKLFKEASLETLKTTGMVMYITIGASMVSVVLIKMGGTMLLADIMTAVPEFIPSSLSQWYIIGSIMVFLFFLGMFIDFIGILFIVIPTFTPVIMASHIDPIWFAIIVSFNLQVAFCSPPFAVSAFFLKSVAPKEVTLMDIYAGTMPFIGIQIIGLILIIAFPWLSLWIPKLLF